MSPHSKRGPFEWSLHVILGSLRVPLSPNTCSLILIEDTKLPVGVNASVHGTPSLFVRPATIARCQLGIGSRDPEQDKRWKIMDVLMS